MKLSKKQIRKISENLDCGLICYLHKETKEIIEMIDYDSFDDNIELWEEEYKK